MSSLMDIYRKHKKTDPLYNVSVGGNMLSTREIEIVKMINNHELISAIDISLQLDVSEKTVYRKVAQINEKVENTDKQQLIKSIRAKGFMINPEVSKIRLSKIISENTSKLEIEKQVMILLLQAAPSQLSIKDLFHKYFLSDAVQSRNIQTIERLLKRHQISLKRKKNYLWVNADENLIRMCLCSLYCNYHNYEDYQLVKLIESNLDKTIIEPYRSTINTYLNVMVSRYQNGTVNFVKNWKVSYITQLPREIEALIISSCEQIIEAIEKITGKQVCGDELIQIRKLIMSSRLNEQVLIVSSDFACQLTDDLLDEFFQDKLNLQEVNQAALRDSLIAHIAPMLYRIENEIKIENMLLEEIKVQFATSYNWLERTILKLSQTYHLPAISKQEIGYLVTYFELYLEKSKANKNAIIVCSSGIGTSSLLKIRIESKLNEIKVVAIVNAGQLSTYDFKANKIDVVISSVTLEQNKVSVPIVFVSPILNERDLKIIADSLREVK